MIQSAVRFVSFILFFTIGFQSAHAGVLNLSELTSDERARVDTLAHVEIRTDLRAHLQERALEVERGNFSKILMGDPISPETQAVLLKGIFYVLQNSLANYGVRLEEKTFNQNLGKVFQYSARLGVFPRAFTVGYLVRAQAGVGGAIGTQFNFYFDHGKFKVSSFSNYSAQVGFAEMVKVEFNAALCFGTCAGGDAKGLYLGLDGYAGVGPGGSIYVEGGIDLSDMVKHAIHGGNYSVKDLYKAKAIYVGMGFDVGEGAGISTSLTYYDLDFEKVLANPGEKITPQTVSSLRLY